MASDKNSAFWESKFGKEYTLRNNRDQNDWDDFHLKTWGTTKIKMYESFLSDLPRDAKILEVGSNTGLQLVGLQRMGFTNLYGIELQPFAIELSKKKPGTLTSLRVQLLISLLKTNTSTWCSLQGY